MRSMHDKPGALPQPPAPARIASVRRWTLVATILGSSMTFVDATVVNVALPALQADLHATITEVQWVIEAYALFLGALILVGGAMGDQIGRKRVFLAGEEHALAADLIAHRAADEDQRAQEEGVRFDDPLHLGDRRVKIRLKGGKGHVHDGRVDERHARAKDRGDE